MQRNFLRGWVFSGMWLLVASSSQASSGGCYNAGVVCKYVRNAQGALTPTIDGSCPKAITTLYIANSGSPTTDDGWMSGPTPCGFDNSTHKPCGDYSLGDAVCGPGVSTGTPFPDPGDPCDPSSRAFDPEACSGGDRGPYVDSAPLNPKAKAAVQQHLMTVARQALPPHVERAVEALGNVSSIHLRARITLSSEATGGQSVPGIYEYWEKGGKYRIHFGIDLPEISVTEIAYNGRQYQLALGRASTLSVARADERDVSSEIPNPFFLVLRPFVVATPDCPFCELRLSDLRALRDLRHTAPPGKSSPAPMDTAGFSADTTFSPAGNLSTSTLTKSSLKIVERAEFSEYGTLQGTTLELPRSMSFVRQVTEEHSVAWVSIQYQIEELEIDRPIDDAVFTLDRSPYASIWENDHFVRSPRCSKNPAPAPMR